MGFLDKAKKMAEQAQAKLDEAQQQFNSSPGGQQGGGPVVEYDKHGRPIPQHPPEVATPPQGDPLAGSAPPPPHPAPRAGHAGRAAHRPGRSARSRRRGALPGASRRPAGRPADGHRPDRPAAGPADAAAVT